MYQNAQRIHLLPIVIAAVQYKQDLLITVQRDCVVKFGSIRYNQLVELEAVLIKIT
jgi:hypothetical protein